MKSRIASIPMLKSLVLLAVTILSMETCLQVLTRMPVDYHLLADLRRVTSHEFSDRDFPWVKRFLRQYVESENKSMLDDPQGEYRTHPRLGWVPRANMSIQDQSGNNYTTNSMGFRSLKEYSATPEQYTVLIVGDSFTYGSVADDSEVWPTILQELNTDFNVLNLGVGGYGIGQMYLMLEEHFHSFSPDLVIAAFIDDDLHRTMLGFRTYKKPKFEIQARDLMLTNVPVGDMDQVVREIRGRWRLKLILSELKIFGAVMNLKVRLLSRRKSDDFEELNRRIFDRMIELSEGNGAHFLALYLPHGRELTDPDFSTLGERFYYDLIAKEYVDGLNPRGTFLRNSDVSYSKVHYKRPAAELVARVVNEKIRSLQSYEVKVGARSR